MIITDWGRLLIDTFSGMTVYTSENDYYKRQLVRLKNYNNECYISSSEISNSGVSYSQIEISCAATVIGMFGGFNADASLVNISYGELKNTRTKYKHISSNKVEALPLESLSYEVVCSASYDIVTRGTVISGVINNTTEEDLTIKYLGYAPTTYLRSSTSSETQLTAFKYLLSYIELTEPITLAPGESYAFKLSFDVL